MKVEIKNLKEENKELKFPCLMHAKNRVKQIVLMAGYSGAFLKGTVISNISDSYYPCGYYSKEWITKEFELFEGSITLSND